MDLISRQAAIDVLSLGKEILSRVLDDMDVVGTEREKYSWGLKLIESNIKDIEELPSAQPEQRWIPCEERLPENRVYVLVTYRYEYGLIDHGITWYGEAEKKWNTSREIIAWKPLPEPWKGEQPC